MIKKVLLLLLISLVLVYIAVWIWSGGPRRAWNEASRFNFSNLLSLTPSPDDSFKLPWQPAFPVVETPLFETSGLTDTYPGTLLGERSALEREYDELYRDYIAAKNFGTPSPYRGQVAIVSAYGARESDPGAEFLEIGASGSNTAPVSLANWSIQSALTGARLYLPKASSVFTMGVVNMLYPVQLEPGTRAVITSGPSPVGISFRENMCAGYLGQMQNFYPALTNSCPAPESILPLTSENIRVYGESCFDLVRSVPACTTPYDAPAEIVSPACRAFVLKSLSYNGCLNANRWRAAFLSNIWRLYLGVSANVWGDNHDVIRLLDAEGRTVDVVTY